MFITVNHQQKTLYRSLVKENFDDARELLKKGHKIPALLYNQVTWHDNPRILEFLLEQNPDQIDHLTVLSVQQGAINCLKLLVESNEVSISHELLSITPRKNVTEIQDYLRKNSSNLQTDNQMKNNNIY